MRLWFLSVLFLYFRMLAHSLILYFLTEEIILKSLINCSEQMKKLRHGIKEIAPIPAKSSRPC